MLDTSTVNNQAKTIVFIDAGVNEYQSLVKGVTEGVEAIVLESDRDGIQTITAELEKYASRHEVIEAVHIISHGSAGSLQLGNRLLNRDTLAEYRSQLGRWQKALTSTAEVLLYGCNVAAGMGANFVRQLSELAGAKIAASVNLTGNAAKGGDWNLDFTTGEITAPIALMPEVVAAYDGVLATLTVTNVNDSGIGSLRDAIGNAQSGDTIKFASTLANKTITLTSGQLTVNKDLTIDGGDAAGLTISGNNTNRVIFVPYLGVTKNVTLRNLTFADGFTQDRGGAIETERQINLNIDNSQFHNNIAGSGGAIETGAQSTIIVTNSKFDNNQAKPQNSSIITPWDGAGAIRVHSLSNLTVKNSEFTNNKGTTGAAINSLGSNLTIEGSTFVNNDSTSGRLFGEFGQGGAILTDGASLRDNGATSGEIIIRDSIFEGNKAAGGGGAGFLYGYSPDRIIIEGSSFVNNSTVDNDLGENGLGGAIRHGGSELEIKNTTFANNQAMRQGGGVWTDDSPLSISNSTFSGNQASRPPEVNSGFAGGGGAMAFSGPAEIVNTTIANNYAGHVGGGIFGGDQATVKNTIFYNNEAGNGLIQHHTTTELNDGGGNIQYPNKETTNDPNDNNATANITIADPKLGPLEEINGRLIHPLLEGSPAINAGTDTNAPTTDQLGQSRVGQVDIGAYEFTDTTTTNPPEGQGFYGGPENDTLNGTDGNDTVSGNGGNDLLRGNGGNDVINGGDGVDTMNGGAGDDIYIVDNSDDVVNEGVDAGNDVVRASATYNLRGNIENLVLTGNGDIDGTGNNSDNRITGNDGNNKLIGGNGNDTLVGNAGNDTFNGGAGNDVLNGGAGNDVLNGWTGADTMNGGAGDDIYVVDSSNDVVYEEVNSGNDVVISSVSYNLGDNVENLTLKGNSNIDGTGNDSDNRIHGNDGNNELIGGNGNDTLVGNAGNDTFDGGAGNDVLNGGAGNDVYVVDSSNDVIYEAINGGNDVVTSSVSYNLKGNIEELTLTGNSNIDGIGNNSDNRITGNAGNNKLNGGNGDDVVVGNAGSDTLIGAGGNDILNGGAGDDSLIGHAGSDRFLYKTDSSFSATDIGQDIIADFNKTENDKILLSKTTFDSLSSSTGLGFSVVAEFEAVTSDTAAATSDAAIVYNSNNGKLFYNPDGSAAGFGSGGLFATLNNKAQLEANDFVLQS